MCKALREIMADELSEAERKAEIKSLVEKVTRKLAKGKTLESIADELEEDVERIRPIVSLISKYAPDYDIDAIYNALKGEDK